MRRGSWSSIAALALALTLAACGGRSSPSDDGAASHSDARFRDASLPPRADGGGGSADAGGTPDADAKAAPDCPPVGCKVFDDCCTCAAMRGDTVFEPCPATCEQPSCAATGIKQPRAYCLAQQCLLGDAGDRCGGDGDCGLVNDCCGCGAWPKALAEQRARNCAADCLQPACDGLGLAQAYPRCVDGLCRLVLPTR